MNIYLLERTTGYSYDEFIDAVVIAKTEEEARGIHPSGNQKNWDREDYWSTWEKSPADVKATLIGKAKKGSEPSIVIASFNAG